ncbi:MAG: DUF5320 domain-containing protein [Actinomycetota bacterium]
MPGFDGTGPAGQGSLTGRGMGFCIMPMGTNASPYMRPNVNTVRGGYMNYYPPYFPARRLPASRMGRGRGRRGIGRR